MAAPTAWRTYREFKDDFAAKTTSVDLANDAFKIALFLEASNCGNVALATAHYATLTNQHANANGYATGGKSVTPTWSGAAGVWTFDVSDPAAWTASGGSIVARFAVLYDDTTADKDLIAYCILDSTPADVTATNGNTLTVTIHVLGVFTLSGGEA